MRISKKLTAALAGALILGTSTFAYADPGVFSLVPADPPLNGRVDCTDAFGEAFAPKNPGQISTILKAFGGPSASVHDQFIIFGVDNGGDLAKSVVFELCNVGPNN